MDRRGPLRQTLGLNLSQRLVMTPSLLQKIELLTLNRLELSDLLNQELAENPVLEETIEQPEIEPGERSEEEKESAKDEDGYEDFDYEYFFGEYLSPSYRSREREARGSIPAKGSSRRMNAGFIIIERAISSRLRSPPERV